MKNYLISDDKNLLQLERIYEMLAKTYWAADRTKEQIQTTIENSLCFGIYGGDSRQIGFARAITDYAALFYLADVVVADEYRGQGLGKNLLKYITEHKTLIHLTGFLNTKNAHGLYEGFGFTRDHETSMRKARVNG